jgi:hypothetical protein
MPPTDSKTGSLEIPTMIKVNAASAPVMGIIEEVTNTQVRLRSMSAFVEGDKLEFDLTLRGAPKTHLTGRITSAAQSGTRKVYVLSLKDLPQEQQRSIGAAAAAAKEHSRGNHDGEQTGGLTRSSVRVPVQMDVRFTFGGGVEQVGRATDISIGGILLNFHTNIPVGSAVELSFRLPGGDRDHHAQARVVAHQQQSPNYNMAFHTISDGVRAAIAVYVATVEKP